MMDMLAEQTGDEADRESDGFVRGLAIGTVTNNSDPDGLARVRVKFKWHIAGQDSFWARIATPMAMGTRGVYFVPEVGDEVLVGFDRGEPAHPFIIGSLWNGDRKPPKDNADHKNDSRIIVSRAESELHFFDGDKPSVELKLKDGKHLYMDGEGIVLEDENGNKFQIDSNSGAITIECSGAMKLKSGTMALEAKTIDVKASGNLTLKGAMVNIN